MKNDIKIGIIDYGLGNLFSVTNAFRQTGVDTILISSKQDLNKIDAIVLPGVGAFGDAMKRLKERNLIELIKEKAKDGLPILGICLGMQLLMNSSEEFGYNEGLGLIEGKVIKFSDVASKKFKIPQIQWNKVNLSNINQELFSGLPNESFFYFLHSYYVLPENPNVIATTTQYKGVEYCSSIKKGNIFGAQFHPEKSSKQGLQLFKNFIKFVYNEKNK